MNNEKSLLDSRAISTLIFVFVLTVVGAIWYWLPDILTDRILTLAERGQFGDSYGAVTSLFTGLAFAGLIFTILLQQRDIKLQRQDFVAQLNEMERSRKEAERQSKLQEQQLQLQQQTFEKVQLQTIALDLMRSVERLETSIDNTLKETKIGLNFPDINEQYAVDAYHILTNIFETPRIIAGVIPAYGDADVMRETIKARKLSGQTEREILQLYAAFSSTGGQLNLMRDLLNKHKDLGGHNGSAVYYKKKYKLAVTRLRQTGYPIDAWDDINQISQN